MFLRQIFDANGNHFFFSSCQYINKTKLRNAIRDALAHVFRTLGQLAGFTDSPHSVTRETAQLLPNALGRRPDVGLNLLAS